MKGTEVPSPRHSSACDCSCVLTRIDHCLVTLSCLPCIFCFVSAYAKFAHEFLTLYRPCATYFSFSDSTALICFIAFSHKLHSAFCLDQKT